MGSKLNIVVVNHNGYEDTVECLESLLNATDQDYQLLLVDNSEGNDDFDRLLRWASKDQRTSIETNYPDRVLPVHAEPIDFSAITEEELAITRYNNQFIFIKAKENKGFAAANNIALRYLITYGSNDDLIWLVNNDTVIAPQVIMRIKEELIANKRSLSTTLFGTPLLEYYQPETIQAIAGKFNKWTGLTSHVGQGLPVSYLDNKEVFRQQNYDYPIGASLICSTAFLKNVGPMNESYFLFFEELDWVARAKRVGGGTKILPIPGVFHKHGMATLTGTKKKKSVFIDLLSLTNRIKYTKTYHPGRLWAVQLFILTVTIGKRIIAGQLSRIPKIIKIVFTT
ncbi:glycosyltransferase family 2 protein [Aquimarina brevivitae]|uniref:Glycosyltransferase 2-like domain-containing protein n=1 Tax=Aquimarina brevivitae TaxID=323412 RepID=A0A4Q7PFK4_9FLAO|nr:glycosyltransferase family 2 protein [Aquimarina brevivitae]RZS99283.1 hypothetical protein EV197_0492 [Aquimarina brevivitae]